MYRSNWVIGAFLRYAAFGGRARRLEFLSFYFVSVGLGIWAVIADMLLGTAGDLDGNGTCLVVLALLCVIPNFALIVRRLHDMGRSGWWLLAILFVPVLGWIAWACLAIIPGSQGLNGHGLDPRDSLAEGAMGWLVSAALLLYAVPLGILFNT